jgi:hypothetical protein
MDILSVILQKLGKASPEELSPLGKETYYRYRELLEKSQKGLTIPDLYEFMKGEKEHIISDLASPDVKLNGNLDIFLKARLRDCLILIGMMESPQKGAEMLERYLKNIHDIKS